MTHPHRHGIGVARPPGLVFERSPMIVYWEVTTACGLACRHCRATAMCDPGPGELSTVEALSLLDDIAAFNEPGSCIELRSCIEPGSSGPHLVLTGGDPLRRADLDLLVAQAVERGIGVSLAPAVTSLLTRDRLAELQAAGVQAISLSLDGSDPAHHDGLRGVPGTFDATVRALEDATALGLPVQVNTLVAEQTLDDLPAVFERLQLATLLRWSLFFLISVGRGQQLTELTPSRAERLMRWLDGLRGQADFQIRTVEAMSHRRVVAQRMRRQGADDDSIAGSPFGASFGIRDGNGIVFVAHDGVVHPSGFLPLEVGSVRSSSLVDLYRTHPVMTALRDTSTYRGRCGRCEFASWCGGSRARAFAWTGDPFESDPLCSYEPRSGLALGAAR